MLKFINWEFCFFRTFPCFIYVQEILICVNKRNALTRVQDNGYLRTHAATVTQHAPRVSDHAPETVWNATAATFWTSIRANARKIALENITSIVNRKRVDHVTIRVERASVRTQTNVHRARRNCNSSTIRVLTIARLDGTQILCHPFAKCVVQSVRAVSTMLICVQSVMTNRFGMIINVLIGVDLVCSVTTRISDVTGEFSSWFFFECFSIVGNIS